MKLSLSKYLFRLLFLSFLIISIESLAQTFSFKKSFSTQRGYNLNFERIWTNGLLISNRISDKDFGRKDFERNPYHTIQDKDFERSRYDIISYKNFLACLYKVGKTGSISEFKSVLLDSMLHVVSSIDYHVPGKASLVASVYNKKYLIRVFYSRFEEGGKIFFYVSDSTEKIVSAFFKTDLQHYFDHSVNADNVRFTFIQNNSDPEILLVQPYVIRKILSIRDYVKGKIFALNLKDGKEIWTSPIEHLSAPITTSRFMIALSMVYPNGNNADGSDNSMAKYVKYQIHFIDKKSGKLIQSIPFLRKEGNYRVVSVFGGTEDRLIVAGEEINSNSWGVLSEVPLGKFYLTIFKIPKNISTDSLSSSGQPQMGTTTNISFGTRNDFIDNSNSEDLPSSGSITGFTIDRQNNIALVARLLARGGIIFYAFSIEDAKLKFERIYNMHSNAIGQVVVSNNQEIISDNPGRYTPNFSLYELNKSEALPQTIDLLPGQHFALAPFGPVKIELKGRYVTLSLAH